MHQKSGSEKTCKEGINKKINLGYRKKNSQEAQPSPAGAAAWRVLSARVGGIVQRGWKVRF
jgi:hypothetical protein